MSSSLNKIAEEVAKCKACPLYEKRTNTVPGEGNPKADIMFVGEGPGENEDNQGRPFVGRAGKFLEELLGVINLTREDVYITNVVKCRPPGNRDPFPVELETCSGKYLGRQIKAIQPKLIVPLGRYAMDFFISGQKISQVHGKPLRLKGRVYYPMYHPAAALYRGNLREDIIADFRKIPAVLKKVGEVSEETKEILSSQNKGDSEKADQESLF